MRNQISNITGVPVSSIEQPTSKIFLLPEGVRLTAMMCKRLFACGVETITATDTAQLPGDQHPQLALIVK